jgi:hypothetical protein
VRHLLALLALAVVASSGIASAQSDGQLVACNETASATPDPQAGYAACLDGLRRRSAFAVAESTAAMHVETIGTPEWLETASVADLDGGADRVRAVGAKLKAFADADPNADANGVTALGELARKHFDELANAIAEGVALEEECRADNKCMAERAEKAFVKAAVLPLCRAMWGAENAQLMIAQERSNPARVVRLTELHNQEDALRYYRRQVAALQVSYRKTRGHNLGNWQSEPACVHEAAAPRP